MAAPLGESIAHLLRRAGFGGTPAEIAAYTALGYAGAVDRLVNYEQIPDDVDSLVGKTGYALPIAATSNPAYAPNYILSHARSRWLFRMLYTQRPLQEKMTRFWHNYFATGYTSIANDTASSVEGTRLMAAVPADDVSGHMGQVETLRSMALGNFFDILLAIARDPAMLYWLDGRLNFKTAPQENWGREVMELFTMGLLNAAGQPNYTEDDVKAAARIFTGWNLAIGQVGTLTLGTTTYPVNQYTFLYNSRGHDTDPKTFTFPIYPDGTRTIPTRVATAGAQDGLDFLAALVRHPSTALRLATKLYQFFVNDITPPSTAVNTIAGWLQTSNFDMRTVMRNIFLSDFFLADENFNAHYRWPVEHVISLVKTLGPGTIPLANFLGYLDQMDEKLYDPPTVEGYKGGASWINTTTMLARGNVVSPATGLLTGGRNTEFVNLAVAQGTAVTRNAATFVDFWLQRFGITQPEATFRNELITFVSSGTGAGWTGTTNQMNSKTQPLIHLIGSSAEYAFA